MQQSFNKVVGPLKVRVIGLNALRPSTTVGAFSLSLLLLLSLSFFGGCQPADPVHPEGRHRSPLGGADGSGSRWISLEATSASQRDYAHHLLSRLMEAKNLVEVGLNVQPVSSQGPQDTRRSCEQMEILWETSKKLGSGEFSLEDSHIEGSVLEAHYRLNSPYCLLPGLVDPGLGEARVEGAHYFRRLGLQELEVSAANLSIELKTHSSEASFFALAELREDRNLRLIRRSDQEGIHFHLEYIVQVRSARQTLRQGPETAFENGEQYIRVVGELELEWGEPQGVGEASKLRVVSFAVESMGLKAYMPREIRARGRDSRQRYNEVQLTLLAQRRDGQAEPLSFSSACGAPSGELRVVGARQVAGGDGERLGGSFPVDGESLFCSQKVDQGDPQRDRGSEAWMAVYDWIFLR